MITRAAARNFPRGNFCFARQIRFVKSFPDFGLTGFFLKRKAAHSLRRFQGFVTSGNKARHLMSSAGSLSTAARSVASS
jgi:hypothetical protein